MKHGVLLGNGVFCLSDQNHVRVVVLFKKLENESLFYFAFEYRKKHLDTVFLRELVGTSLERVNYQRCEYLLLFVH